MLFQSEFYKNACFWGKICTNSKSKLSQLSYKVNSGDFKYHLILSIHNKWIGCWQFYIIARLSDLVFF